MAWASVRMSCVDGVEHRRGVDGLVVEAGQELGDDQADEGAIGEVSAG